MTDHKGIEGGLQAIFLKQREAVTELLHTSQELIDQTEFNVDRLEILLRQRAESIGRIERLEHERRRLAEAAPRLNANLQPLREEIQASLAILATMDDRLNGMVFQAQLRLINSMAFMSKFINLQRSASSGPMRANCIVDTTR